MPRRAPSRALAVLLVATALPLLLPSAGAWKLTPGLCFGITAKVDAGTAGQVPVELRGDCPIGADFGTIELDVSQHELASQGLLHVRLYGVPALPLHAVPGGLGARPTGPAGGGTAGGTQEVVVRWWLVLGTGCGDSRGTVQVEQPPIPPAALPPSDALCRDAMALAALPDLDAARSLVATVLDVAKQALPGLGAAADAMRAAPVAAVGAALEGVPDVSGPVPVDVGGPQVPSVVVLEQQGRVGAAAGAVASTGVALDETTCLLDSRVCNHAHLGASPSPVAADTGPSLPPEPPALPPSSAVPTLAPAAEALRPAALAAPSPPAVPGIGPAPPATEPAGFAPAASSQLDVVPYPRLAEAVAVAGLALALAACALYHRIARPSVLAHPRRAALHAACLALAAPATAGELAAATGFDRKTAEYHLVYLVRQGYLREERLADGPRRFLPPALRPREPGMPLGARVLAAVQAQPGATATELAAIVGASPTRVARCVKDLLLDGAIESRVDANVRRLYAPA